MTLKFILNTKSYDLVIWLPIYNIYCIYNYLVIYIYIYIYSHIYNIYIKHTLLIWIFPVNGHCHVILIHVSVWDKNKLTVYSRWSWDSWCEEYPDNKKQKCGSLRLPGRSFETCVDGKADASSDLWPWTRRVPSLWSGMNTTTSKHFCEGVCGLRLEAARRMLKSLIVDCLKVPFLLFSRRHNLFSVTIF